MSDQVMQSYVHHGDKVFFVSTINRESSSIEAPHTYTETLVWEWDPVTRERGAFVGQGEHLSDSIFEHQRICEALFEEGMF